MLQADSVSTWWITDDGVHATLTSDSITTRGHGRVGERLCIMFCCQLESSGGAAGSDGTAQPLPLPTVLHLRSTLGGRTFWFERCSTDSWDALPPAQREARLAVEQRSWPGATAASHRHASCFEATELLRDGSDPSRRRLLLRFPFYACSVGLEGGLLEASLAPLVEGEQVLHGGVPPSLEGRHFGVWDTSLAKYEQLRYQH